MGILNNNQENNQESKRSIAAGCFTFISKDGNEYSYSVVMSEEGKVERDVEIGIHAVAELKPITNKIMGNMNVQNAVMKNELQVNPVNLQKGNHLVK